MAGMKCNPRGDKNRSEREQCRWQQDADEGHDEEVHGKREQGDSVKVHRHGQRHDQFHDERYEQQFQNAQAEMQSSHQQDSCISSPDQWTEFV